MNRNTLLAFLLILLTISLFSSKFYYEKVLKREHPSVQAKRQREAGKQESSGKPTAVSKTAQEQPTQEKERKKEAVGLSAAGAADTTVQSTADNVDADTIWVETEKLVVGISERGARIISIRTKDYRLDPIAGNKTLLENPYIELVSEPQHGGANLTINNESLDDRTFEYKGSQPKLSVCGEDTTIARFSCEVAGARVEKHYRFVGDSYVIGLAIESAVLDGKRIGVGWQCGIVESEAVVSKRSSPYDIRKIHLYDGKNVPGHIVEKKASRSDESGYFKWVGLTSKYFLVALISDTARDADVAIEAFEVDDAGEASAQKRRTPTIDYRFTCQRFASGPKESYLLYVGPSSLRELKREGVGLEKVLFGGWKWFLWAHVWFPALCEFVLWLLIFLQKGLRDYGVVIIVLTVLSRLITYPLTQSSMKSMGRMRELQPKINALRDKHKGKAQKLNQKMMELYKQEGVNPLNPGCLPMLLQMPVFISLFIVLRKSIELRGAGTWLVPWVRDLSKPEAIPGISDWLQKVAPNGLWMYGNTVGLLPVVMAVLTFYQNKMTMKDPNQKAMVYFMPVFMLVLFNSFPSGLVLYWTFSSALALAQQLLTERWKKMPAAQTVRGAQT